MLPSADILPEQGDHSVSLDLVFTHPMERGPTMDMARPVRFGVLAEGKTIDLLPSLTSRTVDGKAAWQGRWAFKQPGDAVFFLEPAPYWEAAEKKFIRHYTKVVVDFGLQQGWDKPVGFPIEIEPLVRPYGLWTGNVFRGIVRKNGKPLPLAEIEVEWVNDGSIKAPADPFITQVIKTDATGTFAYGLPRAGWWGFNALSEADRTLPGPDGKPAKIEIGATIWVKAVDMK